MTTCSTRRAMAIALAALGAVGVTASSAAADEYVLAASKTHKLQIIAEGGTAWCTPNLRLRMALETDSPDVGAPASQIEIMNRLKTPITNDCKTAISADLTVIDPGKAASAYKATAVNGWTFAAVAPAPLAATPKPDDAKPAAIAESKPLAAPLPQQPAPQQPAPQQPTPVAPSPALAPVPVLAASPPPTITYFGALVRWLRDNPSLAQDDATLRLWAFHRFSDEYSKVQYQEFKLQPLLQKAQLDLAETMARAEDDQVVVVVATQFGSYDFNGQRFPIAMNASEMSYSKPCCFNATNIPSTFSIKLPDVDIISGLPMDAATAQAFTERRTRYGSVNRSISIALTVTLDHASFKSDGWGHTVAVGTLNGAAFYSDNQLAEPLYRVEASQFATWREAREAEKATAAKAAAERALELRRQQFQARREQNIRSLASASASVKLANFVSDGELNFYTRLSNLRSARAAALVSGKAEPVIMVVQAESSGRTKVDTTWPGKLEVTVADGQPELKSSEWYLIRGLLTVPDGNSLPAAQLMPQQIYACTQPKCAEATDAATIVDRKLAAFQGGAQ